ncbi:hypothetical protein PF005_g3790 [Phytophthora fragariae]|uniref:RxLR effector protein n=1 Tax=Phytophthora fragariae TaxID=53985 RepID=A0A6A3TAP4_9STRA|nr:hypothetical protein PF003_g31153 [Phytophthora fragariae]KAE8946411.1 hypothetical protein PF009_g3947 [Phytophthora fragariae]KAE9025427.1 hypothetical protein PF011_g3040 [Phytophthora fragariae]KAE9131816.1 hypothetical protein PF010_g3389 [Phytophthora fragariae]KAE9132463.1 hypothetical protein PF007_g3701 [Phytophthora fragariae]
MGTLVVLMVLILVVIVPSTNQYYYSNSSSSSSITTKPESSLQPNPVLITRTNWNRTVMIIYKPSRAPQAGRFAQ